jgi:hypothetical protein
MKGDYMRFTRWDEVFTEEDTHEAVSQLVSWHLSQIQDESARERLVRALSADPYAFSMLDCDYAAHGSGDAYHVRQCLGYFQKRKDLDLGIDRRSVALGKFRESEQKCSLTNSVFKLWASGKFQFYPDVESVFHRAQRIIAQILGDVPELETLKFGFGPGATTQIKRKISSARAKLGTKFCCSEDLVPIVAELLEQMPAWLPPLEGDAETAVVDVELHSCRLSFVPKTAKTDRGICTEPSLNVMFQRGVGAYMQRRLASFGVDILDQSKNQMLAKEGSITGALATLDLSMASDLIAIEAVYHLLPLDWFFFLSRGRSSSCEIEGEVLKLQKFSSMGNGFTFPLETLIFFALAKACCEKDEVVSAYGDDLIVPVHRCDLVIRTLQAAGFVINTDKSFTSGPFRESCGADYYRGTDIRPFYLRDRLSGHAAFCLHNFYVRRGRPEPAAIVLSFIAESLRIWGPDGYGDGHLVTTEWNPKPHKRDRGYGGFTFGTYTFKPLRDFSVRGGDRVLPCYSIYANEPRDENLFEVSSSALVVHQGRASFLNRQSPFDPYQDRPVAFQSFRAQSVFYRKMAKGGYEMGVTTPGYKGYKRIEIYVLET